MRKSRNKEINVFSVSAIDLFASGMGVFIILYFILIPHINKKSQEKKNKSHTELKYEARMAKLQFENQMLKEKMEEIKQQQQQEQEQQQQSQSQTVTQQQLQDVKQQMQMRIDSLKKELQSARSKLQKSIRSQYESKLQATLTQSQTRTQTQTRTKTRTQNNRFTRTKTQDNVAKKTPKNLYLAVIAGWNNQQANIDMIVIDSNGNEFSVENPKFDGYEGQLIGDGRFQPGKEKYQNFKAEDGDYEVWFRLRGYVTAPVRARATMVTQMGEAQGGPFRGNAIRLQYDGEKKKAMSFRIEDKKAFLLEND